MQNDQEQQDIYDFFNKTNWTIVKNDTEKFRQNLPSYYLPAQSLKTISKSLIWLGFVLDSAVCFTEFMVVWLQLQAPPGYFYFFSANRYLLYFLHFLCWYFFAVNDIAWDLALDLGLWLTYRIIEAIGMCCVNNVMSNKIHGINNPVVYAVGPTGKKAMAGA